MSKSSIIKIVIIAVIVSFFFPFVLVSCSGDSVEATGIELMTTISFKEDLDLDDYGPNYYLILAFLFTVVALAFAKNEEKSNLKKTGICSGLAAVFLLLFRVQFMNFYTELRDYEEYVTVEYQWGYSLALFLSIGSAVFAMISSSAREQSNSSNEWDPHPNLPVPEPSELEQEAVIAPPPYETVNEINREDNDPAKVVDICTVQTMRVLTKLRLTDSTVENDMIAEEYPCFIGRKGSSCEIQIDDSKVSRIHAQLSLSDNKIFIEDMQSLNGTCVNGDFISSATEIRTGDELLIGKTHLSVEIERTLT